MAGAGYRFGSWSIRALCRHLHYEQGSNRLINDLAFSGPAIGATFRFKIAQLIAAMNACTYSPYARVLVHRRRGAKHTIILRFQLAILSRQFVVAMPRTRPISTAD
jgi:hypothetical protein